MVVLQDFAIRKIFAGRCIIMQDSAMQDSAIRHVTSCKITIGSQPGNRESISDFVKDLLHYSFALTHIIQLVKAIYTL